MTSYLLSIGSAAENTLPTVFTALSCGAALPVKELNVFHLSALKNDTSLSAYTEALSACHEKFKSAGADSLFPSGIVFSRWFPVLPSLHELAKDLKTETLLSALRGKASPCLTRQIGKLLNVLSASS